MMTYLSNRRFASLKESLFLPSFLRATTHYIGSPAFEFQRVMVAPLAKQRGAESSDTFKYQYWDSHHDFSTHVRNKNRRLQSRAEKFKYFTTLSQAFVVPNSLADPDVVNFISDLYGSVKRQLFGLLEENRAVDANVKDAHYELFLDNLRVDGKSYVLDIPQDGVFVKYESEDYASPPTHSASKNTLERKRKQPSANNTCVQSNEGSRVKEEEEDYEDDPPDAKKPVQEPVVNVDQWWRKIKVSARKHTEFREKLMDVLEKPHCEKEYERLLEQLNQRKPVQNHRNLRGRTIVYEENRPGKSFLDHHNDLAKRIDFVRDDHPRVLNLLRGFFYWLENLSHEGAFLPWKDPSCLEVLPPSR